MKWIKLNETSPPEPSIPGNYIRYLVTDGYYTSVEEYFNKESWVDSYFSHWMPLPELP